MQNKSLCILCIALAGSSAFAQAKPPEPDYTLAFNVGLFSDYRFRGITQTRFDPALQGGIDFSHKSGFYLGTWASNIKWIKDGGGRNSNAEIDVYGGFKGTVSDIGYDVGVLGYIYPSHKGFTPASPDTTEVYGALSFGPATVKYSHAVTNTFGYADSHNSGYLDISALFDLGNGFSLAPHVGHQRIAGRPGGVSNSQFSYTDYALTLNYDFGNGLIASAAAIGTNAKRASYFVPLAGDGRYTGRDTVVLGLKYNF